MGVGDRESEPDAQQRREAPGRDASEKGTGVLGPGGSLRADDDRRATGYPEAYHRRVEELEIEEVDVEVDDDVAVGGQQTGTQGPA
ncbi:MAG: hypothetical protein ACKOOG_02220, partial [Actinomycetota bacterium]